MNRSDEGPSWRQIWRWLRVLALLGVLAIALLQYRRVKQAESWVSDWSRTEQVSVVLLVPPGVGEAEQELVASAAGSFDVVTAWFTAEHARFQPGRASFRPISLKVRGPHLTSALPPDPPRASADTLARTSAMQTFLGYFDAIEEAHPLFDPNAVYVVFYPTEAAQRFASVHSLADRRARRGFVFAPLDAGGIELAAIDTAHELLHLFGASDKYEGAGCAFPVGYYEPFLEPVHPQRFAEVMALGIPQGPGAKDESNFSFEQVRIGTETAREINWIDEARARRYYDQRDLTAGPLGED